jgi:hypothetical protein
MTEQASKRPTNQANKQANSKPHDVTPSKEERFKRDSSSER